NNPIQEAITLRNELRPGDIGRIVALHGTVYSKEYGFDREFEAYVAGPLAACVLAGSDRDRIWIAEHDGEIVGCIAIVAAAPEVAQLRWFLVKPENRGGRLGQRLLQEALAFCKSGGYKLVFLWTVRALTAAAHLYERAGFNKVEAKPGHRWGVDVIEEKYELILN